MAKQPKTLDALFHDTLKDIYYAEKKILIALPKMAKAAHNEELAAAFEKHKTETEGQVERLEQVFDLIDAKPQGKKCDAIEGILDEGQQIMPQMNDLVPSIGSRIQTYSASVFSLPNSSPMMPWSGKLCRMSVRIAVSAARSAAVTGSKPPPRALLSTPSAVRKNGRIASPDTAASRSTKAAKSMAVMRPFGLSCLANRHGVALRKHAAIPT